MKIHELFVKPVDRPIDGVIKADDARNLQTELEEYVVTRDVARGLGVFTDRYLTELTANGFMEPVRLYESPYIDHAPTGPDDVFGVADVDTIVAILNTVRDNAMPDNGAA